MQLTERAIYRLKEAQAHVLLEPYALNMRDGITGGDVAVRDFGHIRIEVCQTTGCVAGWVVALAHRGLKTYLDSHKCYVNQALWRGVEHEAYKLLDVPNGLDEEEDFEALFYVANWPVEMQETITDQQPGTPEYAETVATRIDQFIAENNDAGFPVPVVTLEPQDEPVGV